MALKHISLKRFVGNCGDLIRFDRPMGTILLFIPCTWGLILGAKGLPSLTGTLLFLIGSFLMRSTGCAYNDWVDQDYDGKVKRSAKRPLIVGSLSQSQAWGLIITFLFLAFLVFLALPFTCQILALTALLLVFIYPWMKRITKWPQGVLGLSYSMGIPMGYAYESPSIPGSLWLVYGAGVLWTIFFDTIYAHQDLKDDLKLGLKSTTQVMPNCPKGFLSLILFFSFSFVFIYLFYEQAPLPSFIIAGVASFFSFLKIYKLDLTNANLCLEAFKKSYLWGCAITMSFLFQVLNQQ
jgi:4-hydroxybenzoate polyprenyl transferase